MIHIDAPSPSVVLSCLFMILAAGILPAAPGYGQTVLYRVNAGGVSLASLDGGPSWALDTDASPSSLHNQVANISTHSVDSEDASVPATTPAEIFDTGRWGPSGSPEMLWSFPVTPGSYDVRLYLGNGCPCTENPGERVFSVTIEGSPVLSNYDIVADVGHKVGTMKQFTVASDASLDIEFLHVTENPVVQGFEIVSSAGGGGPTPLDDVVAFESVPLPTTQGQQFTTLAMGPDGKLYGGTINGEIWCWPLNSDGTTGTPEVLNSLRSAEGGDRLLIGMHFDPTVSGVLWVSHTEFGFSGMPDWGGKITRMGGPNLGYVQDYVVNLPRSSRDHVTNGIDFGPDGALYVLQGSNSAMGAPDGSWALRPERTLSAAVLRLDPTLVTSPPLDVQTQEGGTYDPYLPGAPLTVYASGTRNAYDLVWHGNGELYVPTNGSAAGGNTPAGNPGDPCADGSTYGGPAVPGLASVGLQSDYLFRIRPGGYYGHPNPTRCQYVMNGGNPTGGSDSAEVTEYPVGTAPDADYRGYAFDFGTRKSPNGILEYQSTHFGGELQGRLLVTRYSQGDDLIALTPGGSEGDIVSAETGIPGFAGFSNPLDLVENLDTGDLYVSEYAASQLVLLRPLVPDGVLAPLPQELIFTAVQGGVSEVAPVLLRNLGTGPIGVLEFRITGPHAAQFQILSPPLPPFEIAAGDNVSLSVVFAPGSGLTGSFAAVLEVRSNASEDFSSTTGLFGLSAQGLEGGNEPPLHDIVVTLGHGVDVGGTGLILGTAPTAIGEEVLEPLFVKAGSGPVTLTPVARYSPDFVLEYGWYLPNGSSPVRNAVGDLSGASSPPEHQTLFPTIVSGGVTFDPGTQGFGLYTTSPTRTAYTEDMLNQLLHPANTEHAARIYPLYDREGFPVLFGYLVGFEEASNGDYQDYLFRLENVVPVGTLDTGDVQRPGPALTAYPNPLSRGTRITFRLERNEAKVALRIYGVKGGLVRELVDGPAAAGPNAVDWDGADGKGRPVARGVYLYELTTSRAREAGRLIVVR